MNLEEIRTRLALLEASHQLHKDEIKEIKNVHKKIIKWILVSFIGLLSYIANTALNKLS